jgi:MFS family permease
MNFLGGLASITAPIIGGFIWTTIGPNYVFFFMILIETSKMIILWLAIPETLKRTPKLSCSNLQKRMQF